MSASESTNGLADTVRTVRTATWVLLSLLVAAIVAVLLVGPAVWNRPYVPADGGLLFAGFVAVAVVGTVVFVAFDVLFG